MLYNENKNLKKISILYKTVSNIIDSSQRQLQA